VLAQLVVGLVQGRVGPAGELDLTARLEGDLALAAGQRLPEKGIAAPVRRSTATFSYSVPTRNSARGLAPRAMCSSSCSMLSMGAASGPVSSAM